MNLNFRPVAHRSQQQFISVIFALSLILSARSVVFSFHADNVGLGFAFVIEICFTGHYLVGVLYMG